MQHADVSFCARPEMKLFSDNMFHDIYYKLVNIIFFQMYFLIYMY